MWWATATDASNNEVPSVLNPDSEVMKLEESQAVRRRVLEFGRSCVGGSDDATGACVGGTEMWTINDKIWDPNRVDFNPNYGDVEIWDLVNRSGGWFHPIHVHLVDFKILSRTGGKNGGVKPYERGPKDVAYVGEGETVRVLMKFDRQKGKYMIHCHNLVHEDHDMMTQFEVGKDGPAWASVPAKKVSEMTPLCLTDPGSGGGNDGGGSDDGGSDGGGGGSTNPEPPPRPTPPPPALNAAPSVSPLRPRPNSRTRDATPTIVARVRDSGTDLARGNVRLYLDDREVRNFSYDRATDTLSYTSRALRPGRHSAKIAATDAQGRRTTRAWAFTVVR